MPAMVVIAQYAGLWAQRVEGGSATQSLWSWSFGIGSRKSLFTNLAPIDAGPCQDTLLKTEKGGMLWLVMLPS